MPPSTADWDAFYSVVKAKAALDLHQYKAPQLQRRVLGMVDSRGLASLREFSDWVGGSLDNVRWFLDKMAINVSELFRNPEKWAEMETRVLPELAAASPRLKVWSAGCSYGAEAHTLAMVLAARFPGPHTIVGTDIDEAALAQARRGEFSDADARGVPAAYRRFLLKREGGWKADPALTARIQFRRQNLLADRFDSGHDLILCRNVVIYFTEEAKDALYQRLFDALRPGGVLFVGSTERIFRSREIGYETALPFFYRKPLAGDKQWRNAS